jgi:alpha-D-ribose 1-methylphosphonate 5-triphosphate synthase subunit PhnH
MKPSTWWMPDAQQTAFRAVLDSFARPGTLVAAQDTGADAALMFLSAVLDESVSLADPSGLLDADDRRLLLAPAASPGEARFVLLDGCQPPDAAWKPALGTLESPELGATLVLTVETLAETTVETLADTLAGPAHGVIRCRLQGPGIPGARRVCISGLDRRWLAQRAAWVGAFPLGVDLVLAAPNALMALPRTTHIDVEPTEEA